MLNWFSDNIGTIVVAAAVFGIAALIIVRYIKNKRSGRSSCSCGCANCPMKGNCR